MIIVLKQIIEKFLQEEDIYFRVHHSHAIDEEVLSLECP